MKHAFNILQLTGLLVLFLHTGCKKQLDINHNPNVPGVDNGTPAVVFPAAVFGTTGAIGGPLAILGGIWGQYVTQSAFSSQYKTIDSYQLGSNDLNRGYNLLFTNGLKNYQFVLDKSKATSNWNFYLMAATMKAYSTQILVDLYDQIPYSEALQGSANLSPKFDDGAAIYKNLLDLLDSALTKPVNSDILTTADKKADLVFKGNMENWVRFANSLKMKIFLRMVNKRPAEAQAGIEKLYADGAKFLTVSAGVFDFTDVKDKDNPMYEQNIRSLNTPDNLRASKTLSSFLLDKSDPRVLFFFGTATPTSIHQGDFAGTDPSYKNATVLVQHAIDPVLFISAAESYFMQAEAKVRYFGGVGSKELYNQGVTSSFNAMGSSLQAPAFIATTGAYAYPDAGSTEQKIESISTMKWIDCGFGVHFLEGFFEKNRTGYPKTSSVYSNSAAYVPGQFVVSKSSVLAPNQFPKRLVFPQSEKQANPNTPAQVPITTPVWWAL